ncbi:hypothetical protein LJC56_06895 [Christensenellaceae bacterium OttesenSCG-928-K19]|nr:hypothetical protein [Christensenellaceae bacterium OttesenSCG-928-K19]
MMMKKFMVFVLVVLMATSVCMLCSCGSKAGGGGSSSGEAASSADEAAEPQDISGETVELAIKNSTSQEGTLSALCPDGWYDHSGEEDLFFSESEQAGDYTKPYIKIHYYDGDLSAGGNGEEVSFTLGGMSWEGLYDDGYSTYNVVTSLDEGKLSVLSLGVGPDDATYKAVMESIEVSF